MNLLKIWNGSPAGYTPIEGDKNVLFADTPCAQQIHTTVAGAETELRAVLRRRAKGKPFCRGVAVRCADCGHVVFVDDYDQLASYAKGELRCSHCREREFYNLPAAEQERRQREAIAVWKEITQPIANQARGFNK